MSEGTGTQQKAEDRLHEAWLDVRDEVGYDYLVDLHWDICKEIIGRDEDGGSR